MIVEYSDAITDMMLNAPRQAVLLAGGVAFGSTDRMSTINVCGCGRWHVPCDSCHPFTPATHAPSEPGGRCGFTTDGFRCNDTPLQHRYLCGLLHSHTFVCHPFTSGARDE